MEIELRGISFQADIYDVRSEFARILHSESFKRDIKNVDPGKRPLNFQVELGQSNSGRHNGTGTLILPSGGPGRTLLQLARKNEEFPSVYGRRIQMRESERKPNKRIMETLRKLPFQDPSIDRERDEILFKLGISWRIEKLQFGFWLRRPASQIESDDSIFAVEWEKNYTVKGNAQLAFEYDRKLLRLRLGDPCLDDEAHNVDITFSNIQQTWVGYEFRPYICFDILTPPILESEWLTRTQSGNPFTDMRKFRQRVSALDEHHRRIAPYAHQIRVTLYENNLDGLMRSCAIAGLRKPIMSNITSESHNFYSQKMLTEVRRSFHRFRHLPWTVAFQIECLLHNGLLTTVQYLKGLLPPLESLAQSRPEVVGTLLRDYAQVLLSGTRCCLEPREVTEHFNKFRENRLDLASLEVGAYAMREDDGIMLCHHVTFTPTRMHLEGPYAIQSNRILRRYRNYHDYFLRVDFRDEDRLHFRWDREVDGTTFLTKRVGDTLKNGFELAGRHFEFLAYSSSALREHSVWFVSPFIHHEEGLVNAASIRKEIGDLSEDLAWPAKFAARIALAFSGTTPSVKIEKGQWETIEDLGTIPYLHTEGVGTISRELSGLIWSEENRLNPSLQGCCEPSAYQIRFLGYKGVVVIDDNLKGRKMCLRPSMKKFTAHDAEVADIEIANAFYAPRPLYLNQPLVMLLEDRGAKKQAFINLLDDAIAKAHLARNSVKYFVDAMKPHGLGSIFGLGSLLTKLSSHGLDLDLRDPAKNLRSPFVNKLINCSVASLLRDIQYRCRIPVPESYTLVGVADEGPAYIERGDYTRDEVFILNEGEIFACIQENPDSERKCLERRCLIFRSPTVYPGDLQTVRAVKPPDDKICAFRNLVNVVVFPSIGKRSFASCLSGGDLDGDIFSICQYPPLFGSIYDPPAEFIPVDKKEIKLDGMKEIDPETGEIKVDPEKIIPYVCDFVVEYINSDVLGLLSDRHLVRADQSSDGARDKGCLFLAELCNKAVDYPKNGMPVDISHLPRNLIPYKPDWKKNESDDERRTDFYRSERAVGEIFRKAEKVASCPDVMDWGTSTYHPIMEHPIYITLRPAVEAKLRNRSVPETTEEGVRTLFRRYSEELKYICATHTLVDRMGAMLKEEEVVIGTILARCSRHRWRTERIYRMHVHTSNLVKEIRGQFIPKRVQEMTTMEATKALEYAWTSWRLITDKLSTEDARKNSFGLNSFSIIALNAVFECLDHLDGRG